PIYRRAILSEAALDAHAVGEVLHRVERRRLVRNAAVPGRARALLAVAAQRARLGVVGLHAQLGIVLVGLAGFGVDSLGPVEVGHVLVGLEEFPVAAVERVVEA